MAHTYKNILGLDLGTASIGWAFVKESDNETVPSKIIDLGVRINPLSSDEKDDFAKGKSITTNSERTLKRSMRRNLDRYQARKKDLLKILQREGLIEAHTSLVEEGKKTTHSSYQLRAAAAEKQIALGELARVLLMINKKRGYKSNRKAKSQDEGEAIDEMAIAKKLYDKGLTPGQYCWERLSAGKKYLPDFYRSDLHDEFERVWKQQRTYYPDILQEELFEKVLGKPKNQTWKICEQPFDIKGIKLEGSRDEKQLALYRLRVDALSKKLNLEQLTIVLQEINGQLNRSSGYLGEISDRSKELYFNKQTIGQYLSEKLQNTPNSPIRGRAFYRQDYLDEFETIWETQRKFYPQLLTADLKAEVRDTVIFYQRKLKSQKGLIGFCEFESQEVKVDGDTGKTKTIGARVIPKSSPLFQEFKIWQNLNSLTITNKKTHDKFDLELETKQVLFDELNVSGNISSNNLLKLIVKKPSEWEVNFKDIEGNRTNAILYDAYITMMEMEGHEIDRKKLQGVELKRVIEDFFQSQKIDTGILNFDSESDAKDIEKEPHFGLWHLLYSFEEDPMKPDHIQKLHEKLKLKFGFREEFAKVLANVSLPDDYANLSAKAIRKIFPYIKEHIYSEACASAGYRHSHAVTKEENEKRELDDRLTLLPKNSLRNPVVEKILNQMINVINTILADPNMGRPDEIRVELARELKKGAQEREEMTAQINKAKSDHDGYRKILTEEFGIKHPTRNDIIRYKLYLELKPLGFKTPYSQTYVSREKLFSKVFDIEHIIPRARLFDDSFSNKTLELREINQKKGNKTARDYVLDTYGEEGLADYIGRVDLLKHANDQPISKGKYNKLLMAEESIPDGFVERDLRNTQYIAKKAQHILHKISLRVSATTGKITDKLRQDWGLLNVMKELNIDKYRKLGMTNRVETKDGNEKELITDWTKRNDHRHHAMDALTVAFTTPGHVQYVNYLNARQNEFHEKHKIICALENKLMAKDPGGKRTFIAPMEGFREDAKRHLKSVLISHKAGNKVVTKNVNTIKAKTGTKKRVELTPRGQLHKESIYGKIHRYETKEVKIGSTFERDTIKKVANKQYREALEKRLEQYDGNPKKAFAGANSPSKKPIYTEARVQLPEKVKLVWLSPEYVIRKNIDSNNFKNIKHIEKVVDHKIRTLLKERLASHGNNAKAAFSNLDENPICIGKDEIPVKRVRMKTVQNAEPLHGRKDHTGKAIVDTSGEPIPSDFVSLGNNHHLAFYLDEKGNLIDDVVSFWHAVERARQGYPVVQRDHPEGHTFILSLMQNEYVVFPAEGFSPSEIDLKDPENREIISPNLYRVQKFSRMPHGNSITRTYVFRHHLESALNDSKELLGVTFKRLQSMGSLHGIAKVRLNHLGYIAAVGGIIPSGHD